MKLSNVKKMILGTVIAVSAATVPFAASAQTGTTPQTGTAPETTVPTTTNVENNGDSFDWDWLGLLGLIGLAGLAGRKSDDRTTYRTDATTDPTTVSGRSDYRR